MPLNGLNSGLDVTFKYTDANGVQQFSKLESFTMSENAPVLEQVAMDGSTRFPKFHQGWKGSAVFQRNSNAIDSYIALQETNYYLGADQLPGTITETIKENDGTVSQYQYTNVVLVLEDGGTSSGTDIIKQTLSIYASRKIQLL